MASEVRRGLIRISSSYARLLATLVCGLILTPLLLGWLGQEPFGLIALISSSVGLAAIVDEVLRYSLIREIGAAYHSKDPEAFPATMANGAKLAMLGAMLSVAGFGLLLLLLPLFNIDKSLLASARWLVAAEGLHTCVMLLTAPVYNMYVITERFVADNTFQVVRRASYVVAAAVLEFVVGIKDVDRGIFWYAWLSVGANVIVLASASAWIMRLDVRLRPRLNLATRPGMSSFLRLLGWNTAVMFAINCYDRVGQLIMNFAYGLPGNVVFGVSYQLAAYVRMISLGVNFGVEAVAMRLHAGAEHHSVMASFTKNMTRLHALVSLPAAIIFFTLTEPLLRVWLAGRIDNPDAVIPQAAMMTRILLIPVLVRSIADCWSRILYGIGLVRRYAPAVISGGLINPVFAVLLLMLVPQSSPVRYYSTAISFALVFTVFHMQVLPRIAARCLEIRFGEMFSPILRPLAAAAIPMPILIWGYPAVSSLAGTTRRGEAISLLVVLSAYGLALALLAWAIVAQPQERQRFAGGLRRRLRPTP